MTQISMKIDFHKFKLKKYIRYMLIIIQPITGAGPKSVNGPPHVALNLANRRKRSTFLTEHDELLADKLESLVAAFSGHIN